MVKEECNGKIRSKLSIPLCRKISIVKHAFKIIIQDVAAFLLEFINFFFCFTLAPVTEFIVTTDIITTAVARYKTLSFALY
ncbi:hypothetical protein CRX54_21865 [Klebsiella oxytoca]|nr:hypothetical protein CRX54_21865 [Klebsiella oxytoca]